MPQFFHFPLIVFELWLTLNRASLCSCVRLTAFYFEWCRDCFILILSRTNFYKNCDIDGFLWVLNYLCIMQKQVVYNAAAILWWKISDGDGVAHFRNKILGMFIWKNKRDGVDPQMPPIIHSSSSSFLSSLSFSQESLFEVEELLDHRINDGQFQFLVKCTGCGYPTFHNSWEPADGLAGPAMP
jgi:hypothetical protein